MAKPKFKVGEIVRYGGGPSALFRINSVYENYCGEGIHRYYGEHVLGGAEGRYEDQICKAGADDRAFWKKKRGAPAPTPKTKIVCLCGSTKFKEAFERANLELTLKGYIVLSVGCFMHHDKVDITTEQKASLDKLHLEKIKKADEVYVVSVGGLPPSSSHSLGMN